MPVFVRQPSLGEIRLQLRRKVRDRHIRQPRRHLQSLGRVVVDEHKRINAEIQLARDLQQVLRLRFPVDSPTHKVIPSQRHPLCASASLREIPITQQPLHITEIVLRQRHQQNASVLKRLQLTLELDPRTNALYPILTDNTVPQRIVEVDGDDLLDRAAIDPPPELPKRRHVRHFGKRNLHAEFRRNLRHQPQLRDRVPFGD